MSINEDIKLKKRKEKGKIGSAVGLYKYLRRAAKALVVTKVIVENSTRQYKTVYAVTLPPLQKSLPLSFVYPLLYLWGVLIFILFW